MNKRRIQDYFYDNAASIFWSCFLLLGGGAFVAYYANIRYMPEFDLSSSIAILAAAGVTTVIIIVVLLAIIILPGVIWSGIWGGTSSLKNLWTDDNGNRTFIGLVKWFLVPIVLFYLLIFLISVATVSGNWIGPLLLFSLLVIFSLFILFKKTANFRLALKESIGLWGAAAVSSVMLFVPLWLILNLSLQKIEPDALPSWAAGLISGSVIILFNIFAATKPKNIKPLYWYLILSVIPLWIVFSSFSNFHRVPYRVMEIYNFGNIVASEVVLKEESCNGIDALGLDIIWYESGVCVLENVLIKSRLGREALLLKDLDNVKVRFTVDTSNIITWATRESR